MRGEKIVKKHISIILALVLLLTVLVGCGDDGTGGDNGTGNNVGNGTVDTGDTGDTGGTGDTGDTGGTGGTGDIGDTGGTGGTGDVIYTDGTYTGEAQGINMLTVSVTVTDGVISDVEVTEQDETPDYAGPALEQIPDLIVENNSTDIDAISGATITSNAIKEAVNNALEQAQ